MNNITLRGSVARNPQPIGKDLILAEVQAGKSGKGKVWTPSILVPNPEAGVVGAPGTAWEWTEPTHHRLGYVKPVTSGHRRGMWKVYMPRHRRHGTVEAYLTDQLSAVQFMVRNAPEFFTP